MQESPKVFNEALQGFSVGAGIEMEKKAGFHTPFKEAERFLGLHRDVINDILLVTFD
jgi:hypothetical protein